MKWLKLIFIVLCAGHNAHAGWPQPKGGLYFKLNQWWVIYDHFYSENGNIMEDRTRSIGTTSAYIEYGFTNRFTGILYFPFFSKATVFEQKNASTGMVIEEGDETHGIGDAELSFKYGLLINKPVVSTISVVLGLPFGESAGGTDGSLQTGDGEFNQMLRMDISGSFPAGNFYPYFSIHGAYNNRSTGFSDEYRLGMESGIDLGKITLLVRILSVKSMNNGSFNKALVGTYLSGNNTEYLTIAPELIINFTEKWGIAFNFAKPLSGRQFFAEPAYSVGAFLDLESL